MSARGRDLLSPALLGALERLQVRTRTPLAGRFIGEHRSPRDGSSLDFADYRTYTPGDDFRRIDYHLLARLDTLAIKLFEAEEDLWVRLVIDTSASMGRSGKLGHAVRVAAAIGFVSLVRRDHVSVHTFPLDRPSPRYGGRGAVGPLFDHLGGLEAGGVTGFADAVTALLARSDRPGLVVVISDLLTDEWAQGIRRLPTRGGDVGLVHVVAPDDLEPDLIGDLRLVDVETGEGTDVSLSEDALGRYRADALRWVAEVEARCLRSGVTYVRTRPDDDVGALLLGPARRADLLR